LVDVVVGAMVGTAVGVVTDGNDIGDKELEKDGVILGIAAEGELIGANGKLLDELVTRWEGLAVGTEVGTVEFILTTV